VTVTLLRSGLVNVSLQDQQLAKVLFTDPRPTLLNYVAALVRECLSGDPPVASQTQFHYSIEVMNQLSQSGKANEE
jgi:CCR4-NOT transcription complex subunit 1